MSVRSDASRAAVRISSWTCLFNAFIGGRSNRMVPIPPSTSSLTNSPIAPSNLLIEVTSAAGYRAVAHRRAPDSHGGDDLVELQTWATGRANREGQRATFNYSALASVPHSLTRGGGRRSGRPTAAARGPGRRS